MTDRDGYDIFSQEFRADPYSQWAAMRSGCPIAHSDAWGGSWMPVRYDDIRDIGRDAERFSNRATEVAGPVEVAGGLFLPPLTSDPPHHKSHRDVLMPFFTPKKAAELEPFVRGLARRLVEELVGRGGGDVVADFAQHLTLGVLTTLLGVPTGGQFTDWMVRMMRIGPRDQAVRAQVVGDILAYLDGLLEERAVAPGDDLISYLVTAEMNGEPLTRKHKLGAAFLVLIAGADTTWSAIGASLWHLATHPADRRRLVAEPDLIPVAVEEFLRAYAPVTIGRLAREDAELHGRCIAAGDRVVLAFGAANRDPDVFEDPDTVKVDRQQNRHLTFGSGPHRCLGAHFARSELRITLEEWLRAMPEFHMADPDDVNWTGGQVRGPERLEFKVGP